jgi:TraK protein
MQTSNLMSIIKKYMIGIIFSLGAFSYACNTFGSDALVFEHDSTKKIKAVLGTKSQTRISMPPYSIREIVGDSNKYKIIHDTLGASIFIIPKVKAGNTIELTIITTGGKTQDFSFDIKEIEGSTILINSSKLSNNKSINKIEAAKEMIKHMAKRNVGKYYVIDLSNQKSTTNSCKNYRKKPTPGVPITCRGAFEMPTAFKGLEIKETHIYGYKLEGIKGIILQIQNTTKKSFEINEEDLRNIFKNALLISLESKTIKPKSFIKALVVLDLKEEE